MYFVKFSQVDFYYNVVDEHNNKKKYRKKNEKHTPERKGKREVFQGNKMKKVWMTIILHSYTLIIFIEIAFTKQHAKKGEITKLKSSLSSLSPSSLAGNLYVREEKKKSQQVSSGNRKATTKKNA